MNTPATVLIVDDVRANRQVLLELLDREGYHLVEAGDGEEALVRASESPPDVVLLDVMMPGMDGFEVCRRLRADAQLAEVPVIMVTALDDEPSRLAGLEAGADDFLTKPFNRAELRARVRTITRLNRYRRLHEQRARFAWVIEHAADGYLLIDSADRILYANTAARAWLSVDAPDAHARRETFLSVASGSFMLHPPELWQGWPEIAPETVTEGRLLVGPEGPKTRGVFIELSVHDGPGSRLLRLRDVTERHTTQRDQRAFQTMVSHKLRTPLNALHGSLTMLALPGALSSAEFPTFSAIALNSAKQLTSAVDDVLRFAEVSKLRAGTGFVLASLQEVVTAAASAIGVETCRVTIAPEVASLTLAWPATAVEWALLELMENAKKFHPRNAPAVEVSALAAGKQFVVLTVSDDGAGFSPEELARAGQPYTQGEKLLTGETPGMGLGLASVASLAWQAGGSFRVRNRVGSPGGEVQIRLPASS